MKLIGGLAILMAAMIAFGSGCFFWQHKVDPGTLGVLVDYGQGTSEGEPKLTIIQPGTYVTVNPVSQWLQYYPSGEQIMTMVHQEKEGRIVGDDSVACTDHDGVRVFVDTTTRWQVDPKQLPQLFIRHPKTLLIDHANYDNSLEGSVVRGIVRSSIPDQCGAYTFGQLMQDPASRTAFEKSVNDEIRQLLTDSYLQLNGFYLRDVIPNQAIKDAMDERVKQQQAAITSQFQVEQAKNKAEAQRTTAQGEADSIRIVSEQLARSGPSYTAYLNAQKWDGKMPQFVGGGGSGPAASILLPAPAPAAPSSN